MRVLARPFRPYAQRGVNPPLPREHAGKPFSQNRPMCASSGRCRRPARPRPFRIRTTFDIAAPRQIECGNTSQCPGSGRNGGPPMRLSSIQAISGGEWALGIIARNVGWLTRLLWPILSRAFKPGVAARRSERLAISRLRGILFGSERHDWRVLIFKLHRRAGMGHSGQINRIPVR
jgi:hypothetical protein